MSTSAETVRLHITPFSEAIYEKNIPLAIRNNKPKVSFHALQTFPERGFGYLELAKPDAEAIRNKLNGSMLKGTKVRIEEAKPMKRKSHAVSDEAAEPERKRSKKVKVEKRAREVVLTGYELPADRAVKRGWSDEKGTSKKVKKAGEKAPKVDRAKAKTLVKTIVPANVKPVEKDKSRKRKEKGDKKRTRKNETVVKEFAHNRSTFAVSKASSATSKQAVEYRDGEGWVDEDGEIVEPETIQSKRKRGQSVPRHERQPVRQVAATAVEADSDASSSRDGSESDGSDEEDTAAAIAAHPDNASAESEKQPEDYSEDDSDQDSDSSDVEADPEEGDNALESATTEEVHPLEALYKRSKPGPIELAPINTSFSFFGGAADQDDVADDTTVVPPQTPHTKSDLDWRGQRSAAPTPDTAAIDGKFGFPFSPSDEDEEDEPSPSQLIKPIDSAIDTGEHESDFRKFFYEHRGDSNRAWKERRREAKRLERQRENRRLSRRVV